MNAEYKQVTEKFLDSVEDPVRQWLADLERVAADDAAEKQLTWSQLQGHALENLVAIDGTEIEWTEDDEEVVADEEVTDEVADQDTDDTSDESSDDSSDDLEVEDDVEVDEEPTEDFVEEDVTAEDEGALVDDSVVALAQVSAVESGSNAGVYTIGALALLVTGGLYARKQQRIKNNESDEFARLV